MKILVLNCGSSSVKFHLFKMPEEKSIAHGIVEEIGQQQSRLIYKSEHNILVEKKSIPDFRNALEIVINFLRNEKKGVIGSKNEISAIGHRVVHGGTQYKSSTLINHSVMKGIEQYIPTSPLHNPANLLGIKVCNTLLPGIQQVAVFDTALGSDLPPSAYTYAIPKSLAEKYKIRRYGFHGTSHFYAAQTASQILNLPIENLKIITCHLGNGASVCAIKNGKCVETSMGFTPLEGLIMGTRSGDIDPAILPFIAKQENLNFEQIDYLLNKQSGMLALTGDSDFRVIERRAQSGSADDLLAIDIFAHRIKKYIGAYTFIMNGVDVIVFTAGIGEKSYYVRERILSDLEDMQIILDKKANKKHKTEISAGRVKILILPANEELAIARETARIIDKKSPTSVVRA